MAKGRKKQAGFVLVWFVFFVLKAVIVRVTELTETHSMKTVSITIQFSENSIDLTCTIDRC